MNVKAPTGSFKSSQPLSLTLKSGGGHHPQAHAVPMLTLLVSQATPFVPLLRAIGSAPTRVFRIFVNAACVKFIMVCIYHHVHWQGEAEKGDDGWRGDDGIAGPDGENVCSALLNAHS